MAYLIFAAAVIFIPIVYLVGKAMLLRPGERGVAQPAHPLDAQSALQRLSQSLQCETTGGANWKPDEFLKLHQVLEQAFPLVHEKLEKQVLNDYTLVYRWRTNSTKKPILLMAHMDVVPVTPGTEDDWAHGPYSGDIADGCVWGRGAIDMKNMLMAEIEAVEYLLGTGFTPDRDIFLLFGHDEEILGKDGSYAAAQMFHEQGIQFEFTLDEGGSFAPGEQYGAQDVTLATVAVYEKGYVDLHMSVTGESGHSSMPGETTALSDMARAIDAIDHIHYKPKLTDTYLELMRGVAPFAPLGTRVQIANANLFQKQLLQKARSTVLGNALVTSTISPTMLSGSHAANVLPREAKAVVNFRLNPGDTVDDLKLRVAKAVGSKVEVHYPIAHDASRVASTDSRAYQCIKQAVLQTFDGVYVTPAPFFACTDSRHFDLVSDNVYKFIPFLSNLEYSTGMHGTNERIGTDDYIRGISFFIRLLENTCS